MGDATGDGARSAVSRWRQDEAALRGEVAILEGNLEEARCAGEVRPPPKIALSRSIWAHQSAEPRLFPAPKLTGLYRATRYVNLRIDRQPERGEAVLRGEVAILEGDLEEARCAGEVSLGLTGYS